MQEMQRCVAALAPDSSASQLAPGDTSHCVALPFKNPLPHRTIFGRILHVLHFIAVLYFPHASCRLLVTMMAPFLSAGRFP